MMGILLLIIAAPFALVFFFMLSVTSDHNTSNMGAMSKAIVLTVVVVFVLGRAMFT